MSAACESIKAAFPDLTALPNVDADTYQRSNALQWSNTTILNPGCIFAPSTPQQLADGLARIISLRLPFAIRSGGHMPNPGWNNLDAGVLVSLEKLNEIEYVKANKVAKIGVAAHWAQVYEKLLPHKVTVAGGTNGAPAVGGLTLGGGISLYYNQVGYTADTVVNFQVVLASGKIVDANTGRYSDLFWALKGGSSNFGVVTRVDFKTLPSQKVWAGMQVFNGDQFLPAVGAMNKYINSSAKDNKVSLQFAFPAPGILGVNMFYDGPGPNGDDNTPKALKDFTSLKANASTLSSTTCAAIGSSSARSQPSGLRRSFNTLTILKDTKLLSTLIEKYQAAAAELKGVAGFFPQIVAMTLTQSFLVKSMLGPAGVDANGGELICIIHLSTWTSKGDDDKVQTWTKRTTNSLRSTARAQGKLHQFIFMNDAGTDQDVFAGYTAENREALRCISRKYDPTRIFQVLQNGGFKIGM